MSNQEKVIDEIYQKITDRIKQLPQRKNNFIVEVKAPRITIKFNRPKRYNAFTLDMYITLTELIHQAQNNNDIKFIIFIGEGGNFSSGNDLTNFTSPLIADIDNREHLLKAMSRLLNGLTQAIIKSKKPIIALVQGKNIGFTFTMLALLDKVFAVQNASFTAPLVSSGQGPELCASYTFPKIFGKNLAQELVTFGRIVNSEFLQKFNLVEKCKSKQQAEQKMSQYINKIDDLDWQSYSNARRLYKEREEKILLEVNQREISNLIQRWLSPNLMINLAKHMERMKKSAKL